MTPPQKTSPTNLIKYGRQNHVSGKVVSSQTVRIETIFLYWFLSITWLLVTVGFMTLISPLLIILLSFIPFLFLLHSPLMGLVAFLTIVIWQNLAISIWSPLLAQEKLPALQGINFIITAIFGAFCFLRLLISKKYQLNAFAKKALKLALALIFLAFVYAGYGAIANGASSSAIYFRNFTGGLFCLALGVYFGNRLDLPVILRVWALLGILVLCHAFLELFLTKYFYEVINLKNFIAIKYHLPNICVDQIINKITRTLFNTPYFRDYEIKSFRMLGPNLHHVSFGYLLSFLVLVFSIKRKYLLAIAAFFFLAINGAKGPAIFTVFTIGFTWLYHIGYPGGLRNITVVGACISLVLFIFLYGLSVGDFHVLGLLGGINDFLSNPFGHGLGFGGNLAGQESFSWQEAQNMGATPHGLESSVGVLLSQWGVGGVLYLFFLLWVWKVLLRTYKNHGSRYFLKYDFLPIFLGFGFILVNMAFQEEALSPTALGFEMLWVGFIAKSIKSLKDIN